MSKSKKNNEEDMSQTFIAEVGQKSAIADDKYDDIDFTKKEEKKDSDEDIDNSREIVNYEEEKKTSSTSVLIVIVAILSLIVGVAGGYYLFKVTDKEKTISSTEKKETNAKTEKEVEELNPEGLYVEELISRYDQADSSSNVNIYEILYKEDKTTIKDIDDDYLKALAANKASKVTGSFSDKEFKNATKLLYGDQTEFSDGKIDYSKGCIIVKYNDGIYNYVDGECGGSSTINMERKIVKTKIEDDKLIINVAVAIVDSSDDKVYKNYSENEDELEEVDNVVATTFDIDKDYTKLNQYKYTFNYDKDNNNYYLVSIELVK